MSDNQAVVIHFFCVIWLGHKLFTSFPAILFCYALSQKPVKIVMMSTYAISHHGYLIFNGYLIFILFHLNITFDGLPEL